MRNSSVSKLLKLALIPAVVGVAVSANAAGSNPNQSQTGAAPTSMSSSQIRSENAAYRAVRASEMIGMNVNSPERKDLGEIKDVIVNMNTGDVRYAVLEFDPGIFKGERLFAVPAKELDLAPDRKTLVYKMSPERLENARIDQASWDKRTPLDMDNLDKNWGIAKPTDGARAHRASDLIGKDVNGRNGKDIGDIKDLVINLQDQKVHYAVLAFDPGWTSPEKLYAFPLRSFNLTGDRDEVVLDIDKARLQQMKSLTVQDFARLNDPAWKADMDRYFVTVFPVVPQDRNATDATGTSSPSALFGQLDTDENGTLSKSETKANSQVQRQWSQLDKDGNGQVTRKEFTTHYASNSK
ncbi:MAG: PRC-barrel domain-containing protein [Gammaproteobacteria bacterium]|jgi:sporulation protein YlmC with PRC-barrel domain|nr:PRC-barrel domain-containing protein [Gammaproteobacteria bacterium]MBU1506937.1 PRC-barrel domain-containing protein [Gammaproteobacteria bacterium]MBU2121861.1 PRC-barrel domain-containing protein [Gammaproteobacteria bacterium]MBU2172880.1 PRC-barrel domain-containing protein [Gammaproteobacteria bacterium]MBU2200616.1 PRC-barrel domain-containing protein [Gammaproteobacteria bacterium]